MSTRIENLAARLNAALHRRIMNEVRRRLAGQPVSAKQLAVVDQSVRKAIAKAAQREDVAPSVTISLALARNPLTAGIVQRSTEAIKAKIRENVLTRLPQSPLLQEVYRSLERGETVDQEKLIAARDSLYSLTARQASAAGIPPLLLSRFDYSLFKALMEIFPLLGLDRAGFNRLDWTTAEQGIKNVRYQVFRHNPGLERELAAAEELLADPDNITTARLRAANAVRLKLHELVTEANLNRWDLSACRQHPYFPDLAGLIARCFPLAAQPLLADFVGDLYFRDPQDLGRAFLQLKARQPGYSDENLFLRQQDLKVQASFREKYSLSDILKALDRILGATYQQGRTGRKLAPELVFKLLLGGFAQRQAQQEITRDLHQIRRSLGLLNESLAIVNRSRISWLNVYGMEIFPLLFGQSLAQYLKSPEFWAAGGKK